MSTKKLKEKGQERCLIEINFTDDVKNRDLLLDLKKELETPFETISYKFLFILTVAILIFTYLVFDRIK